LVGSAGELEHISPVLRVADLDAAVTYYKHALGFAVAWRWGDPPMRAGLARDAVEVQLVQAGAPGAPAGPAVVYCQARGVAAYHAACVARGARIIVPLTDRVFGMQDFRVEDLDGNVLGFGEPIRPSAENAGGGAA
jgi:catechol 2,3-dioxygenase-like lactoylglutathione lyase family enzyme